MSRLTLTLCSLLLMLTTVTGFATEQAGDTWVVKRKGRWKLPYSFTYDLIISNGTKSGSRRIPLDKLFSKDQREILVSETTAGPFWGLSSFPYIYKTAKADYFCMRFWNGYRFSVNLATGQIHRKKFPEKLIQFEKKEAVAFLSEAAAVIRKGGWVKREKLYGAISIIIANKIETSYEDLLVVEKSTGGRALMHFPGGSYGKGFPNEYGTDSYSIYSYEGRQHALMAMLKLGLKPKGYPPFVLSEDKERGPTDPELRRKESSKLRIGDSAKDVYQRIGAPDFIMDAVKYADEKPHNAVEIKWREGWRYDFGAPDDFSLILTWDDSGNIRQVLKVTPGLWRGNDLFEGDDNREETFFRAEGKMTNGIHLFSPLFEGKIDEIMGE